MPNINIAIANKRATVEGSPVIICGNSDYTVTFAFDDEWSLTGVRTARFVFIKDGAVQHEDRPFEGNTVEVPVLSNITFVDVGVFAGDLCTTTPARIRCQASILCNSGEEHEPSPDVYQQIMALFNDMAEKGAFGATEVQAQQIVQNTADISQLTADKAEQTDLERVEAIAKGKNRARVFSTTASMEAWLSDADNKGAAIVGDNLYIEELKVPDWWIAAVLEEPNAAGRYYEIAQLETQKVDLSPIMEELAGLNESLGYMRYANLPNSLGTTSYGKPWLELEAQLSSLKAGHTYVGNVSTDCVWEFYGWYAGDSGTFFLHTYRNNGQAYLVTLNGGTWHHEQVTLNSDLEWLAGADLSTKYSDVSAAVLGVHNQLTDGQSVDKWFMLANGLSVLISGSRFSSTRGRYSVRSQADNYLYVCRVTGENAVTVEIAATTKDIDNVTTLANTNIASRRDPGQAVRGAYKIKIPEEYMVSLQIAFRTYNSSAVYYVSGYTYSKNNWHLPAITTLSLNNPETIGLYTNSDKTEHYIVIGNTADTHPYPQVDVVAAGCGYGDADKLRDLITIELTTDISDLTLNVSGDQRAMLNKHFTLSNGVLTINLD